MAACPRCTGAVEVSLEFKVNIPFVKLLGMTLEKFDPDMAEIHLELREELTNSWSVAHGGVSAVHGGG